MITVPEIFVGKLTNRVLLQIIDKVDSNRDTIEGFVIRLNEEFN